MPGQGSTRGARSAIPYRDGMCMQWDRLARVAVARNNAPPRANHGFQRMRPQWVSSRPTFTRSDLDSVNTRCAQHAVTR